MFLSETQQAWFCELTSLTIRLHIVYTNLHDVETVDQILAEVQTAREKMQESLCKITPKRNQVHHACETVKFLYLCLSLRLGDGWEPILARSDVLYPRGYARALGVALLRNSTVTAIPLTVTTMCDSDHDVTSAVAYIEPLVRYLRTSQSLRRVLLCGAHASPSLNDALVNSLLLAIADNPHVEELDYSCHVDAIVLGAFMSKAKSLKVLRMDLESSWYDNTIDFGILAGSLGSMVGTLESFTLKGLEDDNTLHMLMVQRLEHSVLHELRLSGDTAPLEYWQALGRVLQSAPHLQHLDLMNFQFDATDMSNVITCLFCVGEFGSSSRAFSKLSLTECNLDEDAAERLTEFLHTTKDDRTFRPWLSDLYLHTTIDDDMDVTGPAIANMLLLQPSPIRNQFVSTIGSQIRTLSLTWFASTCDGFLTRLARFPHRVQLEQLRLTEVDPDVCRELRRCLSKLPSLREIHLSDVNRPLECSSILVDMLRGYEGLCIVSTSDPVLFSADQLRRMDAYRQRNLFLMRHFCLPLDDSVCAADRVLQPRDLLLQPLLLETTKYWRKSTSRAILSGLLALQESVGGKHHAHPRVRSGGGDRYPSRRRRRLCDAHETSG